MAELTGISLGWGVQSFTMVAMSALGELPMVDVALHSDTTYERERTYAFAAKWTPWLEERGIHVVTVSNAEQTAYVTTNKTDIPAFTTTGQSNGMLRRQCTGRWKIDPMRRWITQELKQRNVTKSPGIVEQWLGITVDEAERMKPSDVKYIVTRWPLIEKRMTRQDCISWLIHHGLEVPPKSSCVFCPYHSLWSWWELKDSGGPDWEKSIEVDRAIRKVRPPHDLYLHPQRIPLEEIRTPQDNGQMSLFSNECEGVCGV